MEKELMIYNAVANVAARVFASFDAVMFQPGKYDVPAVLNRIKSVKAFQDEDAETAANEIVKIEIDTFSCSFRAVDSFSLLKRLAAAYQIPTAFRAQFTKKADAAPVAVSFRVFAGLKDLCSRISKDDLHPCFNYICVDTRRRALIVCDQHTLSAVPVPEMFVSEDAKETYLITPAVLKAGHGVCNIDVNGTATNGAAVSAVDEEIKYPNIARVLFAVPSEFITLGKKAFSELKKNVSAAAKFGKSENTPVILKADAGANEIEIIGYRESETETNTPRETRRAVVSLPQPVPFAFAVAVDPERLGKVLSAEKMFLKNPFSPVCFVDETRRVFSVMYPGKDLNHTPYFDLSFEIPVPADSLPVDAVAGTFAPVQDAPAAPFEDEETAPAVPAVSEETKITYITKNHVPVITDEIKNAMAVSLPVPVSAVYPLHAVYIDHVLHGVYFSKLLADEIFWNAFFSGRAVDDLEILSNETAPETERAAVARRAESCKQFAAVQDAQETPAADIETLINNKFAAYLNDAPAADSVPAVSVDEETRRNIETAAQAYMDEYICTDEELRAAGAYLETRNIKIRRRRVYLNNEIIANITQNINNGVCVSVAVEYLPAVSEDAQKTPANVQDEETAANVPAFVSVWACMPEIWQTDAPAVSEDAQETAANVQDEETPAVANSRRRFHVWPWLIRAAAVIITFILFAVNDAKKTPAVADSVPAVLFAVPEDAQETNDAPAVSEDAPAVAVQDETPAVADKQPQTRRKRARRAESCKQFAAVAVADSLVNVPAVSDSVPVSVADSLAADSVPAALFAADSLAVADSLANVPAVSDSVPVSVADSLAADSLANVPAVSEDAQETAPAVQDEETDAPAVVSVPEDEETPAVADSVPAVPEDAQETPAADSVPADSVPAANSPAPAVPAVQCAPAAPVAPVAPIIIVCFGN